jgi:type I restriction enzyme S subunit
VKYLAVPLDDLVTIVGGGTPSKARPEYFRGRIPWVSPKDMKSWHIDDSEDHITEEAIENSTTSLVQPGTVLVVIRSGILKHTLPVAINRVPVTLNQDMKGLLCGERVTADYLARALQGLSHKLLQTVRGTTADNIPTDVLRGLELPVPPLAEQERIAAILERADRLRRLRRYAVEMGEEILRSVFLKVFGDATLNPNKWDTQLLREFVVAGPQNGVYKPASAYGTGTPILRIDGFYDAAVEDLSQLKRVRLSEDEIASYGLHENDIVINRVNSRPFLGKSAIIPMLKEPTVFESNLMRISVDTGRLNPSYLIHLLQTDFIRNQIQLCGKDAVNQASINQEDVKGLQIRLPAPALQKTFANVVRPIERLRAIRREALRQAEHLFQTLLHRAFTSAL